MAVNLSPPSHLQPISGLRLASVSAIKPSRRDDLTVMAFAAGTSVSAVLTQNRFAAPPVTVCRKHLEKPPAGGIRGLAINAGIANAGTLTGGLKDAQKSCSLLAQLLQCPASSILPFSTGVIMERLPMERYTKGLTACAAKLDEDNWRAAARAIMTTDTVAKGISRELKIGKQKMTITGIAKGSGMIHPNMATMLAFVATDAAVSPAKLSLWQKEIVKDTFNAISVDGDTSTNDSFVLIATGKACKPSNAQSEKALKQAIFEVCAHLAEAIVRDGEGASKLLTIHTHGGKNHGVCKRVAEAVAKSPLVKTALAAGDANVGRLLMAIGNAGDGFNPQKLTLKIGNTAVIRNGGIDPQYNEASAAKHLAKKEILIEISLGSGKNQATLKTCDLTHRYIEINADYRS